MASALTIKLLAELDPQRLTVATVCSHSSLQIFHGARQEGLPTLGIAVGEPPKFHDAFPLAKPDDYLLVESYDRLPEIAEELRARHCVVIPHGSIVQYLGVDRFEEWEVLTFGNRASLRWESDRNMERRWLESAGLSMPREMKPEEIDTPVMVKYFGARGGRGFFIARTAEDFIRNIRPNTDYTIQEYIVGTRYYIHYFFSPLAEGGFRAADGALELLSADRRDETNIDEMYKLGSQESLKALGIYPTFVVTGNIPVVLRESLLPYAFEMGKRVVARAAELFGGLPGSFCLETVVTDQLRFRVFEISARIVAGTNPFTSGAPYADYIAPGLSTGRRIAQEIRAGVEQGRLEEILS